MKKNRKTFVLDTNILLHSPNAIFGFDDNVVVITGTTLQELDSKKSYSDEIGYNARETCRILETLKGSGDYVTGIPINKEGLLMIESNGIDENNLPKGYSLNNPDNRIISAVLSLMKRYKEKKIPVILVTNDISMKINASVCGIEVESYKNDHLTTDEFYSGRIQIEAPVQKINKLYADKKLDAKSFGVDFVENQFVTLKCGQASALSQYKNGELHLIMQGKKTFGVTPKNEGQVYFLKALMAPAEEIPIVIASGPPGCAKTFLSLAAGLDKTYDSKQDRSYDRILITRNNVMSDADFGYLPGELEEKMTPLLAPFFDNLESLIRGNHKDMENNEIQNQIDYLCETKIIDICPLAYMRGRSITNSYLIVDEAQNATRSQIRDIITRAGKGTKVVLLGDPNQIDNHLLDKWNNGLTYASEKMKGSPLCAQITFKESESVRSELATEAIMRLN